jgi:hypothetical protein
MERWQADMHLAQAAGIDAFVLNVAPPLAGRTSIQVAHAFQAAASLNSNFKLLFAFDYLGGGRPWTVVDVVHLLRTYTPDMAYFRHNNLPLVSTFEGCDNINDWLSIRASIPEYICFMPCWTSLGPKGISAYLDIVDGAFSWDMWPQGANDMSDDVDTAWKDALGEKPYMMGVSPWFYTKLPYYRKAWVWRGDDLWHARWQQVLDAKPAFVQIVSWNDYGESHYIGPIYDDGVPRATDANAHPYVDNMPHDGWRDILPYYISKYKTGGIGPLVSREKLCYWYRLSPAAAGSDGGVTGNHSPSPINLGGYQLYVNPDTIVQDKVFVTALVREPSMISVQIGFSGPVTSSAVQSGLHHFSTPFTGKTGRVKVTVVRNGKTVLTSIGTAIDAFPTGGITNYNAWVGSAST